MSRSPALDLLRGIAALLMVQQHLGVWLVDARTHFRELTTFWVGLNMLGGLAAPLFIFIAGAGAYAMRARPRTLALRGGKLLALGYLLNLAAPSWFEPWSFYVLHLLGAWLVFGALLARLNPKWLTALALVAFVIGALGQVWLHIPRDIDNEWMSSLRGPFGVLRLALFEGHFPLFPWLGLALVGAKAMADRDAKVRPNQARKKSLWLALPLGAVGGVLLTCAELHPKWAWRPLTRPIFSTSFYPASLAFCLLIAAACLISLDLTERATERWPSRAEWLKRFGHTSLSLFFVHVVVFRQLLPELGLFHSLSPKLTLLGIALTLILWQVFTAWWKPRGYRFGLEWFLRRGEGA
jgi:uncharacterized membrane protein